MPQTLGEVSPTRAAAIHQCVEQGGKLLQKDWGVRQLEVESSCMAQHGQPE